MTKTPTQLRICAVFDEQREKYANCYKSECKLLHDRDFWYKRSGDDDYYLVLVDAEVVFRYSPYMHVRIDRSDIVRNRTAILDKLIDSDHNQAMITVHQDLIERALGKL